MNTSQKTHPRRKFQIGDLVDHASHRRLTGMTVTDYIPEVKPRTYWGNGGVDFIPGHAAYYVVLHPETSRHWEFQSSHLKASETVVEDPSEPEDAAWDRKGLLASKKFLEESLSEADEQIDTLQVLRSELVNTLQIINRNLNEI